MVYLTKCYRKYFYLDVRFRPHIYWSKITYLWKMNLNIVFTYLYVAKIEFWPIFIIKTVIFGLLFVTHSSKTSRVDNHEINLLNKKDTGSAETGHRNWASEPGIETNIQNSAKNSKQTLWEKYVRTRKFTSFYNKFYKREILWVVW